MPRYSASSALPESAASPYSPPSNITRSKLASDSSASNLNSPRSVSFFSAFASASSSSSSDHRSSSALLAVEDVVALQLELVGELDEHRHRGQEDGGGLAALAGPHETADGLGEEQRSGDRGGVHADGQPRHVHALGDHPDRDHPAVLALAELLDLGRGLGVVGEHDRRRLAGDVAQHLGVRAGRELVGRDDQARPRPGSPCAPRVSRLSAARSTDCIQLPAGSSAVRQAWLTASCVIGSPSEAAISSPALVRQRICPA